MTGEPLWNDENLQNNQFLVDDRSTIPQGVELVSELTFWVQ